ncbi:nuclear transport factor 2 family protein [Saccharothrix variisporea]|uniref:SnoaL-like protein n=1 Tax=Saccharothrix variisporea TaxID=543527 RepID=A0A495X2I6_9PSEU|nr:nuclear transport factor 2 family protein [Saccharothrix variisporea]RKT67749.1 SnoaL-like protein [Saccharothrix variisporea]
MTAQDTALAYFRAWTGKDFDKAMTYIADDIVCDAPPGRIEGAEAFRAFMGPFAGTVEDSALLAAFGDDTTAVLVYDTKTALVPSAPGAEYVTVQDGRITHMRIIFDRAPFEAARARASRD